MMQVSTALTENCGLFSSNLFPGSLLSYDLGCKISDHELGHWWKSFGDILSQGQRLLVVLVSRDRVRSAIGLP